MSTRPSPESDESILHYGPISVRPVLILSSNLLVGLPSGLLTSDFATKIFFVLLSYACCMPCQYNHA
jgi:hypothetical protein